MSGFVPPGARIGPYVVERLLGRGGMGEVYAARDARTGALASDQVAIKVLPAMFAADPLARARFEREAVAARALRHPNVVALQDAGVQAGYLWLAFELVNGAPLDELLRARGRLPWREAAALGAQVARALEAVHATGFVHRDVKPSNVLVEPSGHARLADFGLARALPGGAKGGTLTEAGDLIGTPRYFAPEQAAGKTADAPSDLYALGVTLHELISGDAPFTSEGPRLVRDHLETPPPSLAAVVPDVPEELVALVLRLLAKDPAARGTAAEVAALLERLSSEEPSRAISRRTRAAIVALVLLASAGALLAASVSRPVVPTAPPTVAPGPPPTRPTPPPAPPLAPSFPAWCEPYRTTRLTTLEGCFGSQDWNHAEPVRALAVTPDGSRALSAAAAQEHSVRLWDAATGRELRSFDVPAVSCVALSPDGALAVAGSAETGEVRALELATGKTLWTVKPHLQTVGVAIAPVAHRVVSLGAGRFISFLDGETGQARASILGPEAGEPIALVAGKDGSSVATLGRDGELAIWNAATAMRTASAQIPGAGRLLAAGGSSYFVATEKGSIYSWSGGDPRLVTRVLAVLVHSLSVSDDGRYAVVGSSDGKVRIIDLAAKRIAHVLAGHAQPVLATAMNAKGNLAFTGGEDRTIKAWDVATGREVSKPEAWSWTGSVAWTPDGRRLVCGGHDRVVRVRDARTGKVELRLEGHEKGVACVALSRDGRLAASGGYDGRVRLWDLATGNAGAVLGEGGKKIYLSVSFSEDGRRLLAGTLDDPESDVRTIDVATGKVLARSPAAGGITVARWTPDERDVIAVGWDRSVRVLDGSCTATPVVQVAHGAGILGLAIAPDGRRVLTGSWDKTVKLWERGPATWRPARTLRGHSNYVGGVAISPDGRFGLSSSWDRTLRVWDLATGDEVDRIDLANDFPTSAPAFSPDGTSFAVGTARSLVLRFRFEPARR